MVIEGSTVCLDKTHSLCRHLCVGKQWMKSGLRSKRGRPVVLRNSGGNVQNPKTAPHQATFGEMTLEDFLIKAGVVREQCTAPFQQQQRGLYESTNNNKPAVATGESPGRSGGYELPAASTAAVYGGRAGNGGGYGQGHGVGTVAPLSPMSSDGMVTNFDNSGNQFGIDMGGLRGRERIIDGPVEKVAERRQRRMIKNRESAARSRARKQAYTVELEAELNQLKEENKQLQHALAELERKRKQQCFEEPRMKAHTRARKTKEKLRLMRRNSSCSLF
ncbi:hypothetical protein OIU84_011256 [Salix udensis]|uniref:BZIP domain-containing protein n=1 Tax=Salix udensis TaxID=889485 RepID=A0AAD6JPL7_9ROSI|nr:hypothetical protein OIU84_011256 [Salix udensis]